MPAVAVETRPLVALRRPLSEARERLLVKRLVLEAVVAKSVVVVACVEVELRAVKLAKVLDALVRMPPVSVARELMVAVVKVAPLEALN